MSASAAPPTAPAPARPRLTRTDAGLIAAGAGLTVLFAAALTRRPLEGLALLVVLAVVALVLLNRERLARMDVGALLVVGLVVLPAAALLGPSFAIPGFPQAFLFRIVLALVIAVGVTYLVVRHVLRGEGRGAAARAVVRVALRRARLVFVQSGRLQLHRHRRDHDGACLLYTSDAADEEDSVDL